MVPLELIRSMPQAIREFKGRLNLAYKFKLSHTISPRDSGAWDVNAGLLRWIDKEIVLRKMTVRVTKVKAIFEIKINFFAR